jgi:hypothetical protein
MNRSSIPWFLLAAGAIALGSIGLSGCNQNHNRTQNQSKHCLDANEKAELISEYNSIDVNNLSDEEKKFLKSFHSKNSESLSFKIDFRDTNKNDCNAFYPRIRFINGEDRTRDRDLIFLYRQVEKASKDKGNKSGVFELVDRGLCG